MQTHEDNDHKLRKDPTKLGNLDRSNLEQLARKMMAEGRASITAGAPGEQALGEGHVGHFYLCRMPGDPLGILRISIGEGPVEPLQGPGAYLVYRGDVQDVLDLLMRACHALSISCMEMGRPVATMHHVDPPNGHPEEKKHGAAAAAGQSGEGRGAEGTAEG